MIADKTSNERLAIVLPIVTALLASGHYTQKAEPGDMIITIDVGSPNDDSAFVRRHMSLAVMDAIDLAEELVEQLNKDGTRGRN